MSIQETQYRLTLLGDALQGLGLSMSIHMTPESDGRGITDIHAQKLSHLVECMGMLATQLSSDLEDQISDGANPKTNNGGSNDESD